MCVFADEGSKEPKQKRNSKQLLTTMQNRIRQFLQTLLLNRKGATLNRQVRKDVTVDRKMHYERKCHSAVEAK